MLRVTKERQKNRDRRARDGGTDSQADRERDARVRREESGLEGMVDEKGKEGQGHVWRRK